MTPFFLRTNFQKNQSGFSLVSVIIASSVMMVVGLAIATLIADMTKSQNYLKFNSDANTINEEIRALLSSPRACENSFVGQTVVPASNIAITNLFDGSVAPGIVRYTQGQTYGDRSLILTSMTLSNYVAGPSANLATMTLTSTFSTAKTASGPQQLVRSVNLSVTKNPTTNVLTTCIALSKMSDGIWQRSVANTNNIFFASPLAPLTGGNVGIGEPNPGTSIDVFATDGPAPTIRVGSDGSTPANPKWPGFAAMGYSNNNTPPVLNFLRARGNRPVPLAIQNQDQIGGIGGFGYNGINFDASAGIAPPVYMTFIAEGPFTPTSTPTSISFSTSAAGEVFGTTRMIIQSTGNVGIGVINPAGLLSVGNVGNGSFQILDNEGDIAVNGGVDSRWAIYKNGAETLAIEPSGHVLIRGRLGINNGSPTVALHVAGSIIASGSITPSDLRLKKNINHVGDGVLENILMLNPVNFDWKKPIDRGMKGSQMGFIAQEVQSVFPSVILTQNDPKNTLTIKYNEIVTLLTKAIQEFYKKWVLDSAEIHVKIKTLQLENEQMKSWICTKEPTADFCPSLALKKTK